jgi:histidine triad (HIT) family protein
VPERTLDCDFCAIARGDGSAEVVCETDVWIAFFPKNPATPGHTLVIPRRHVPDFWQADVATARTVMEGAHRVGRAIEAALNPDGLNLITSAGRTAEQTVFHLHVHVVPRWEVDEFGPIWPPKHRYENSALENVADRIRRECA